MKVKAFSIGHVDIDTNEETWREAKEADDIGNYYDARLSDMSEETIVIDPDNGIALNPYGGNADLIKLIRPILDEIPTWKVGQYVSSRRSGDK